MGYHAPAGHFVGTSVACRNHRQSGGGALAHARAKQPVVALAGLALGSQVASSGRDAAKCIRSGFNRPCVGGIRAGTAAKFKCPWCPGALVWHFWTIGHSRSGKGPSVGSAARVRASGARLPFSVSRPVRCVVWGKRSYSASLGVIRPCLARRRVFGSASLSWDGRRQIRRVSSVCGTPDRALRPVWRSLVRI